MCHWKYVYHFKRCSNFKFCFTFFDVFFIKFSGCWRRMASFVGHKCRLNFQVPALTVFYIKFVVWNILVVSKTTRMPPEFSKVYWTGTYIKPNFICQIYFFKKSANIKLFHLNLLFFEILIAIRLNIWKPYNC